MESASFLPSGVTWPSMETEKAGALSDTESSQAQAASLSSPCQCHSSQLVFGGEFFNHHFLLSQGPWPPRAPHSCASDSSPAAAGAGLCQAGRELSTEGSKGNLPLSSLSCRALPLTPQMCKYLKGQEEKRLQKRTGQRR